MGAATDTISVSIKENAPQPQTQKRNFWVGTMVGGLTVLTVTSATVAAYMILSVRRHTATRIHNAAAAFTPYPIHVAAFDRFSWGWWKHRLIAIIHPTSVSSCADVTPLQQQQQVAAAAAAAAATTTSIVNTSVQMAVEQFQKELQTQLVHDRNQSTIQFLNTIQQQERTLTQTLGQPIHSTKQQMTVMQQQIQTLQQMFLSPKPRGTFGEVQLELLIKDVLPSTMYTMQYTLSNKKRVDCMLHLPTPIGNISIDSKFPTLSTTTEVDKTPTTAENSATTQQQQRKREVRDKLHKHINDISSKYIIPGETSPHAICFIPSVSLFLDIVTDHTDVLLYAHKQHVWLTCPTTLLAVLTTMQGISRGQVVAQQTTNIFALITKLNKDIDLLVSRFDTAEKSIERTRTELSKMQISVHKIQKVKMELDVLSSQSTASSPVLPIQQQPHNNDFSYDSNDESLNRSEISTAHYNNSGIPLRDASAAVVTERHISINGGVQQLLNGDGDNTTTHQSMTVAE